MSATLRCCRCGRHPWLTLDVTIVDGESRCNGDDCAEWTARMSPALEIPVMQRAVRVGLNPTGLLADVPYTSAEAERWADASERSMGPNRLAATMRLVAGLSEKAEAYDRINTPELFDFWAAVQNEALHQRERWEHDGDIGKIDADWFWLIGYLAGKALHNPPKDIPPREARLHRIITVAAAAANWHAATMGAYAAMPGRAAGGLTQADGGL